MQMMRGCLQDVGSTPSCDQTHVGVRLAVRARGFEHDVAQGTGGER
jgi:hypothetical protein